MPRNQSFDKISKNSKEKDVYHNISAGIVKQNLTGRLTAKKLKKTRKNTFFSKFFRFVVRASLILSVLGVSLIAGAGIAVWSFSSKLPDITKIENYTPSETSEIYDANGKLLARLHDEENRTVVPLKEIPLNVQNAVLSMEDERFYKHFGIDPRGVARMVASFYDKKLVKGGASTITQQLARNLFLTPEVKITRKIAEWILAVKMERYFTKQKILELYLNQVYWGHNAYGVEAAAKIFFGKSIRDVNLAEAAMMGGLLSSPEVYSPHSDFKLAKWRQSLTLQNMVRLKFITKKQADDAQKTKIVLQSIKRDYKIDYPYFTTYVISLLTEKYGDNYLRKGGLKIYTSIDPRAQAFAEDLIATEISRLQKSNNVGQGALISIDPNTGFIKTIVGGVSYKQSQFNRVTQAKRQPGSSFKPFVYLTAFKEGLMVPESVDYDGPISYPDTNGSWSPKNYDGGYSGSLTIKDAIRKSVNTIAVKTLDRVGVDKVIETAKILGIESYIGPNLAIALGAVDVTPLEMASAYCAFPTGGKKPKQITPILRIEDRNGTILEDNSDQELEQVVSHRAVDMLNDSLRAVVEYGTGAAAALPGRIVAGKTGTTSDHRDSWFIGYTQQLVTAVWIGNDDNSKMWHTTGGGFCAPIWKKYMEYAMKGKSNKEFPKASDKDPKIERSKNSKALTGIYIPTTKKKDKVDEENIDNSEDQANDTSNTKQDATEKNDPAKTGENKANNIEVTEITPPDQPPANNSETKKEEVKINRINNNIIQIEKKTEKQEENKVVDKKIPAQPPVNTQPVQPKKDKKQSNKKLDEELNKAVEDLNRVKDLYNSR